MRKLDVMLKEYVSKLKNEDVKFMSDRLEYRYHGDVPEVVIYASAYQEIDGWLKSARSCWELYDMVDVLQEYVCREYDKRAPEVVRR